MYPLDELKNVPLFNYNNFNISRSSFPIYFTMISLQRVAVLYLNVFDYY